MIAATSVIENSRNSRSTMPPMNRMRDEHRDERQVHRQQRRADLAGADQRRLERRHALARRGARCSRARRWRRRRPGPVATISAISDRLFSEKPAEVHHREAADQRDRHGGDRDDRGADVGEEQQHDDDDEGDGDEQRALGLVQRGADGRRAVAGDVQLDAAGQERAQRRQLRLDRVDRLDDVGVGLAADDQQHRRLAC